MSEKTLKPYDELRNADKMELLEKSIKILSLKPDLLNSATDSELFEKVVALSKTLYDLIPDYKNNGSGGYCGEARIVRG